MNYLSVCSGIEAASCAWHDLGWNPVGFSEIEKFPSEVLKHHYPHVPNLGDMTKFKEWNLGTNVDVFVGGTPCQSFSVAGLRKGLDDPRGNLMLTYLAIADRFRPKWLVWENVPGVLSSNDGQDFGTFLGGLGELGYGFAYRVLDAQYFGVAQRRRRVFVIGYLGDWRPAAAVLFERDSLQRNPPPSRKARERTATFFESSLAQYRAADVGGTLKASGGVLSGGSETFVADIVGALDTECGGNKLSHQSAQNGHLIMQNFVDGIDTTGPLQARDYKDAGTDGMNRTSSKLIPMVYENHPSDSRVREMGDVCQTITSSWGTGGGNVPLATAYSIREDAQANTFSATELEVAVALKALQPSVQSHHAQTFVAQVDCYPISTQNALGRVNGRDDWPLGLFNEGEPAPTLTKAHGHAVALSPKAYNFAPGKGELKDDIHVTQADTTKTLDASGSNPAMHQGGVGVIHPKAFSFDSAESNSMKSSNPDSGCREVDLSKTLDTTQPNPAKGQGGIGILQPLAFDTYNQTLSDVNQTIKSPVGGANESIGTVLAPSLTTNNPSRSPQASEVTQQINAVYQASMAVRRLTPVECERLQGFPDNYTNIKANCPDGPRYKALGNSMAVPVMKWIGQRIADYEKNLGSK
jgi:site-specific DNA-cytosine methylase